MYHRTDGVAEIFSMRIQFLYSMIFYIYFSIYCVPNDHTVSLHGIAVADHTILNAAEQNRLRIPGFHVQGARCLLRQPWVGLPCGPGRIPKRKSE